MLFLRSPWSLLLPSGATAMDAYGRQLEEYHRCREIAPALEEFIPIEHARHENPATAKNKSLEKTTPAQLWRADGECGDNRPSTSLMGSGRDGGGNGNLLPSDRRRKGGTFLPFIREPGSREGGVLPEIIMASAEKKNCADGGELGDRAEERELRQIRCIFRQGRERERD